MLLRFKQLVEHGPRTAYYKEIVRGRILRTPPVRDTSDGTCEIHAMTRSEDLLNLMWALKSFYSASRRHYKLCVHDDGSLTPEHNEVLRAHFPAVRLIDRGTADRQITTALQAFPKSLHFRMHNPLAPKVFDFAHYLDSDRMIIFDSDLLFFREPVALLERIENPAYRKNLFNGDCADAYTVGLEEAARLTGQPLVPRVNSGFGLIHRESIRWDWTEEFLGLPGILDGHFWRVEQTLIALCSSRFGAELLPREYTLHLGRGIGDRPFRHYVGRIRGMMYDEGFPQLVRQGLLG